MPHRRSMYVICICFALSLAAYGCGDSDGNKDGGTGASGSGGSGGHDDHDAGAGHEHGEGGCGLIENCVDTIDLDHGLEVEGKDGYFTLTLHMHTDLTPMDNEWTIMISDADGDAVPDADVTVDVYSVDCMHGGPNAPEEVTTNDMGMATVHPTTLHGGPWDVIITVDDGDDTDTIVLPLCIDAPGHGEQHDPDAGHDAGMHVDDDAGHTDHI